MARPGLTTASNAVMWVRNPMNLARSAAVRSILMLAGIAAASVVVAPRHTRYRRNQGSGCDCPAVKHSALVKAALELSPG